MKQSNHKEHEICFIKHSHALLNSVFPNENNVSKSIINKKSAEFLSPSSLLGLVFLRE